MPKLELSLPNWNSLSGGSTEADWFADRDRKAGLAAQEADKLIAAYDVLKSRGALTRCSAALLEEVKYAADWYISLAGLSLKSLGNLRESPQDFGLTRSAKGLVEALRREKSVPYDQLVAFSNWINSQLGETYPQPPSPQSALVRVAMILGGRIVGRSQNISGNETVILVKRLLVDYLKKKHNCEILAAEQWMPYGSPITLPAAMKIRFDTELEFEFLVGGNHPDMIVRKRGLIVAVAEIKGRKDLSNLWESWTPQLVDHMRTWKAEYPDADLLFFGSAVTQEMCEGRSTQGVDRMGLRDLYRNGLLDGAYNIYNTMKAQPEAVKAFGELTDKLSRLLD